MADFDLSDGFRKAFLAGVGAIATASEKSQEVVDDFVKKGQLTVEQGKALNEELKRKAREAARDSSEAELRARMEAMSPEEREEFAKRVSELAAEIDAEPVEPDSVEDSDGEE